MLYPCQRSTSCHKYSFSNSCFAALFQERQNYRIEYGKQMIEQARIYDVKADKASVMVPINGGSLRPSTDQRYTQYPRSADSPRQRAWASQDRRAMNFSPTLLEPPVASTVAERIEQSPYVKTDVFKKSLVRQTLRSNTRLSTMELDMDGRSKTMLTLNAGERPPRKLTSINVNLERLQNAKDLAEKAIKAKKIFTIQGPYSQVRDAMRRRGWIEKFYKMDAAPPKKSPRNVKNSNKQNNSNGAVTSDDSDHDDDVDDDIDDDDDDAVKEDENAPKPWEEDNGFYGILSRLAKNCAPQFIWCLRRDAIDFRYLRKDQMVNHYGQNGAFTTKVGLCSNLRNSHWFEDISHETFFPRCYRFSNEEEKSSFIDDYYLSACMGIVRWVIMRNRESYNSEVLSEDEDTTPPAPIQKSVIKANDSSPEATENTQEGEGNSPDVPSEVTVVNETVTEMESISVEAEKKPDDNVTSVSLPSLFPKEQKTPRKDSSSCEPTMISTSDISDDIHASDESDASNGSDEDKKSRKVQRLPMSLLDTALDQCEQYLRFRESEDLDTEGDQELLDIDWDSFLQQYYALCHNNGVIPGTATRLEECERMAKLLRPYWPQFDMDGVRNLWIVKPGAKSRGRGIVCYDKLHDMLKLVASVVRKDSKFVVQKYIERPLIIHNTKFDIRQWFLVTDWNPLTIWWYKDFYLRFCKKMFTLDELDEAIHLSNNSIQKHYTVDPARSKEIPSDSMWASDEEFQDFMNKRGAGHLIEERIKPQMQKAVICSLLTTRDIIEYRKSSFELYGADFMLTEDYTPWLLEINSSPALAMTTHVTKRMCRDVIEDTMKVVIDRKQDKNCDTGGFEMVYKASTVAVPQYLGINLAVEGSSIKTANSGVTLPRPRKTNLPETVYQSIVSKSEPSQPATFPKRERRRKPGLKMSQKEKEPKESTSTVAGATVKGKKTPTVSQEKSPISQSDSPVELTDTKPLSEPNSAKHDRSEPLLTKRKRQATKSVEVPKSQLELMKPTDSYLRKIKEGIANAQKMLKVEPGVVEKSFCPKCGSNGIIKLANQAENCPCKIDCIQTEPVINSDLLPYQVRMSNGLMSSTGNLNMASRNRVLKDLQKEQSSQLVVPLAPRKMVIKPPDALPLVASGNMHRFLKSITPGPDTLPYRKAKKPKTTNFRIQKSLPDQTMFVLAESYTQRP